MTDISNDQINDDTSEHDCDKCGETDDCFWRTCDECSEYVYLCSGCLEEGECPSCDTSGMLFHPDEEVFEATDLDTLRERLDEWDKEKDTEKTVGLSTTLDDAKWDADDLVHYIQKLHTKVTNLVPEQGIDLESFQKRVDKLWDLYTLIMKVLHGPTKVKGASSYGGVAGIIESYDGELFHARCLLEEAHDHLKKGKSTLFPIEPELVQTCQEKAEAGHLILRTWKTYKAYTTIWTGKKWTSAHLAETLHGSKPTTTEKSKLEKTNPISSLSKLNIARLVKVLNADARSTFKIDLVEKRQKNAVKNFELAQQALLELNDVMAENEEHAKKILAEKMSLTARCEYLKELATSKVAGLGDCLMDDEHRLFSCILDLPFTIKHATNNWYCILNDGRLDSLLEYSLKNPDWSSEFSTPGNIKKLGNHGFAFFRVDVGEEKIETRYGGTQIIADMDMLEEHGWISLFDQLKPLSSKSMLRYHDHEGNLIRQAVLPSKGNANKHRVLYKYGKVLCNGKEQQSKSSFSVSGLKRKGSERYEELDRDVKFTDFVFYGKQIRLGLALSLVHELRWFHRSGYRKHVLDAFKLLDTEENAPKRLVFLRRLIGQTFRPEGKYPVAIRFTEHPVEGLKVLQEEGDSRYESDGTENPKRMKVIRVVQRRKYLKEAIAQAKKTGAGHQKNFEENGQEEQKLKAKKCLEDEEKLTLELEAVEKAYEKYVKAGKWTEIDETESDRFRKGV